MPGWHHGAPGTGWTCTMGCWCEDWHFRASCEQAKLAPQGSRKEPGCHRRVSWAGNKRALGANQADTRAKWV